MPERHPAAYLRRSQDGGITRDDEVASLTALAHREGHNGDLVIYDDWGHSADESKDRQDRLRELIAEMKANRISTVYAGKIDRLARSVTVFARFAAAMKEHQVGLVTIAEGDLSEAAVDRDPFKWGSRQFMVTMAEMELRTIKARAARAQRVRIARGDEFGRAGYGRITAPREAGGRIVRIPDPARPASVVLDAYREAGSILGAARLLTERHVPSPGDVLAARKAAKRGEEPPTPTGKWYQHTVATIIRRENKNMLPPVGLSHRRTPARALLAQVLVCHCGHPMTPNLTRGQYYCPAGARATSAVHGKMACREVDLMPWIRREAARLRVPARVEEAIAAAASDLPRLAERRRRAGIALIDLTITEEEYRAALASIAEGEAAVERTKRILDVPATIPWGATPATINSLLRTIWLEVRLDDELRPVEAVWAIPPEYIGPAQRRRKATI